MKGELIGEICKEVIKTQTLNDITPQRNSRQIPTHLSRGLKAHVGRKFHHKLPWNEILGT